MFKPDISQFTTPIRIQHRIETNVNGAKDISYQDANPAIDFCKWKSFGGTESMQSGSITVIDTAEVTMWYRPDISAKDIIWLNDDKTLNYEVLGTPENIEMRNQFLKFKVSRTVNS